MGVEKGGGGPQYSKPRPKRDKRLIRNYIKDVNREGASALSRSQLAKIAKAVDASKQHGTFSRSDKKALQKLVRKVGKAGASTAYNGTTVDGPLQQLGATKLYTKLHRTAFSKQAGNNITNKVPINAPGQKNTKGTNNRPVKVAPKTTMKPKGGANRPAPKKGGGRSGGGGNAGMNTSTPGLGPYSPGEFQGPSRREARVIVDRENQQLIRDLLGEAGNYKQDLKYDVNKANSLFNRSQGDLRYIYGEAQDYMGNRSQAIDNRYEQTGGVLGNIYQGLGAAVGQNTDAARANILAEQQRLGIQGSGTADLEADAANRQQIASYLGSAAQSSNEMSRNAANEIGNLLGSMSAASLASAVGRADNRRQDQISDARQGYRQDIREIRGDIGDVKRNRPGAISELHSAMQNNAYQQWAEGQQMAFNNQLATNKFNLDVSSLNSDNFWKRAAARQAAAKARAERRLKREEMQLEKTAQALDSFSKNFTLGNIFGG